MLPALLLFVLQETSGIQGAKETLYNNLTNIKTNHN